MVGTTARHVQQPKRDLFGDFNSALKDAYYMRIAEPTRQDLTAEHFKELISGEIVPINEKGIPVVEVRNISRFVIDSNRLDAIPDEHGERRYFVIKCNEKLTNDTDYFRSFHDEVVKSDRAIRAFYEFLCARSIKQRYHGKDIPVDGYVLARAQGLAAPRARKVPRVPGLISYCKSQKFWARFLNATTS